MRSVKPAPLLVFLLTFFLWACGSGSSPSSSGANTSTTSVTTAPAVTISLTPQTAILAPNGTQQFTASVQNASDTSVTWTVTGASGNSNVGTIVAAGGATAIYTAPATAGSYTVTATSVADPTKLASTVVTVTLAVAVTISPSAASLQAGGSQQFTATVLNTQNTNVAWTVDGALNGSSAAGTISGSGTTVTYHAPATPGTHTVTVTSMADNSKFASATVTVTPLPVTVSVSPASVSVAENATQQFTATVQNATDASVTWAVDAMVGGDATAGSISAAGLYTAPATSGSHTVTATSVADNTKSANATVTVTAAPPAFPSSAHVFLVMEENQSFSQVFPSGTATNCATSGMPNLCNLASANGLALNVYANAHGSLRDYLYLTSGSAWTASPNSCSGAACSAVITGDNLVRALTAAGKTWRGYFEGMPAQGYMGGDTGNYVLHHNPFPWYSDVANDVSQQMNMYGFGQFATDAGANAFQNFSLIVPNVLDDADMPDATSPGVLLATADNWLNTNVFGPLLASPPFQAGGDGILIIVFDEGDVVGESGDTTADNSCSPTQSSGCGGHVALVMIGPKVIKGSTTSNVYQFQDVLHTIVHLLGLPDYPNASAGANDIALLPGA